MFCSFVCDVVLTIKVLLDDGVDIAVDDGVLTLLVAVSGGGSVFISDTESIECN